jgi:hypothetical protein
MKLNWKRHTQKHEKYTINLKVHLKTWEIKTYKLGNYTKKNIGRTQKKHGKHTTSEIDLN